MAAPETTAAIMLLLLALTYSSKLSADLLLEGPTIARNTTALHCPDTPIGVNMTDILEGVSSGSMVMVDVRTKEELETTGKIPGSYNVLLSVVASAFALDPREFESQYGFPKPRPDQLAFTCRSGVRALQAWNAAHPLGYCQARIYRGSFLEWMANGMPIELVKPVQSVDPASVTPMGTVQTQEPVRKAVSWVH